MAVFDVILFLIVVLFAALGVRRGLVLTVCGLLSIVVALGGAKVAADSLSPMVAEAITPRITATVERTAGEERERFGEGRRGDRQRQS